MKRTNDDEYGTTDELAVLRELAFDDDDAVAQPSRTICACGEDHTQDVAE